MKSAKVLLGMTVLVSILGCAPKPVVKSETKVAEPKVAAVVETPQAKADKINAELSKVAAFGFAYRVPTLDDKTLEAWLLKSLPVIKKALADLPEGYVFRVSGHATPVKSDVKPSTPLVTIIEASQKRADFMISVLKKNGVDVSKIITRGAGATELINTVDVYGPENRRVTFKVVPKL